MNLLNSILSSGGLESALSFKEFAINLILAVILCTIAGHLYIRYGYSLSNRRRFARTFVLLGIITTMVISVVGSSLAMSLGMVGALSIVRFRTPIKEPEELVYLFLIIGIGLGLGGNRPILTIIGFGFAAIVIYVQAIPWKSDKISGQILSISASRLPASDIQKITEILDQRCLKVTLRRFDEHEAGMEAIFIVDINSFKAFLECKQDLAEKFAELRISLFDQGLIPED